MKDLKDKTIGMCVSGGLDSKTVTKKLIEEGSFCTPIYFSSICKKTP